jgi:hypothetical protein
MDLDAVHARLPIFAGVPRPNVAVGRASENENTTPSPTLLTSMMASATTPHQSRQGWLQNTSSGSTEYSAEYSSDESFVLADDDNDDIFSNGDGESGGGSVVNSNNGDSVSNGDRALRIDGAGHDIELLDIANAATEARSAAISTNDAMYNERRAHASSHGRENSIAPTTAILLDRPEMLLEFTRQVFNLLKSLFRKQLRTGVVRARIRFC